jgi:hypothetical protein
MWGQLPVKNPTVPNSKPYVGIETKFPVVIFANTFPADGSRSTIGYFGRLWSDI